MKYATWLKYINLMHRSLNKELISLSQAAPPSGRSTKPFPLGGNGKGGLSRIDVLSIITQPFKNVVKYVF